MVFWDGEGILSCSWYLHKWLISVFRFTVVWPQNEREQRATNSFDRLWRFISKGYISQNTGSLGRTTSAKTGYTIRSGNATDPTLLSTSGKAGRGGGGGTAQLGRGLWEKYLSCQAWHHRANAGKIKLQAQNEPSLRIAAPTCSVLTYFHAPSATGERHSSKGTMNYPKPNVLTWFKMPPKGVGGLLC